MTNNEIRSALTNATEIEKAELRMQTRVFRVFYTPALNAQNMIKPVMSAAGQCVVTTPAPCLRNGTIRLSPRLVTDGSAMIGLPPGDRAAPRMKSIWPPMPE